MIVRRVVTATLCGAASLAVVSVAREARAQNAGEGDPLTSYNSHHDPPESPQSFALELRFGPYQPKIDDELPAARPYESTFGTDKRLYMGFELDWQAVRIPYFGTLGPGFGLGYTHMSAAAPFTAPPHALSGETTTLTIMPTYAVGVLRIDALARHANIPLVPYGKLGVGYALWWTGNDLGTSHYSDASGDHTGHGRSYGLHSAFGGMFLLDAIDRHSSVQLDNETGVNNSYFFFEIVRSNLDGFGSGNQLRVGSDGWVMGLALEM